MLRLAVLTVVHVGLLLLSWSAAKPTSATESSSSASTAPTSISSQTSPAVSPGLPFRLGDGAKFVTTLNPKRLSLIEASGGVDSDPSQVFRLHMKSPSPDPDQPDTVSLLINTWCVGIFPSRTNDKGYYVALDTCTNPHTHFQRIINPRDSTQACYVNQDLGQQLNLKNNLVVAMPYAGGPNCHYWHHDYPAQGQCSWILTGNFSNLTIEGLLSKVGASRDSYKGLTATDNTLVQKETLLMEQLRLCQPQIYSDLMLIVNQLKLAKIGTSTKATDLETVVEETREEVDMAFIQSAGNGDATKNRWKSIGKGVLSLVNTLAALFSKVMGGPISCIYGAACALGVLEPTVKLTKEEADRASAALKATEDEVVNKYAQDDWEDNLSRYMGTTYSKWQEAGRSLNVPVLAALDSDDSLRQLKNAVIIDFAQLVTKSPDVARAYCVIHTWKIDRTNGLPKRAKYSKVIMPESARVYLMAHKLYDQSLPDIISGQKGWQFKTKTTKNPNASC
ncbi:hypothetical protein H4R35_005192 [Dimargaris xerosporica]|nr:hypothetical protein H4R35_005192 [Dimargaris xerosporica]